MAEQPRKRRSRKKIAGIVLLAFLGLVLAGVAAGWLYLESDAAAERLRVWMEQRLTVAVERAVLIGGLELDLVPFRLQLTDLRIADPRPEEPPFLRVDRVDLYIYPWALASDRLQIDTLLLDGVVVHLDLLEDGGSNAPSLPEDRGPGGGLSVELRRFAVSDGRFELNHVPSDIDLSLRDVRLDVFGPALARLGGDRQRRGRLRLGGGSLVVDGDGNGDVDVDGTGDAGFRLDPLQGDVRFALTEDRVLLESIEVRTRDTRVSGDGFVRRWDGVHLSLRAEIGASEVAALLAGEIAPGDATDVDEAFRGHLVYEGDVDWSIDAPLAAEGRLTAADLEVAGATLTDLRSGIRLGPEAVVLEDLRAGAFGGSVGLDLTVARVEPRRWSIRYRLDGIDLRRLSRWERLPGLRLAGVADATGELSWQGDFGRTASGTGSLSVTVPTRLSAAEAGDRGAAVGEAREGPGQGAAAGAPAGSSRVQVSGPPLPLTADVVYELAGGRLRVSSGELRLPRNEVDFSGTADLEGNMDLQVSLRSEDLRIADIVAAQIRDFLEPGEPHGRLGLRGAGEFDGAVGGLTSSPVLSGRAVARDLSVDEIPVGNTVTTDLRYAEAEGGAPGTELRLTDLRIDKGDGSARGEARFRFGVPRSPEAAASASPEGRRYRVALELQSFPLETRVERASGEPLDLSGAVEGSVQLQGWLDEGVRGSVDLRVPDLQVEELTPMDASVAAELGDEVWDFRTLRLATASWRIDASGTWQPADGRIDGRVAVDDVDAAVVAELLGRDLDLGGILQGTGRVRGTLSRPEGTASLRWAGVTVQGRALGPVHAALRAEDGLLGVAIAGAAPGATLSAELDPPALPAPEVRPVALPDVDAALRATLVVALDAPRPATLHLAARSELIAPLAAAAGWPLPPELDVAGNLDLEGEGPLGEWAAWRLQARVPALELGLPRLRLVASEPVVAELEGGLLAVSVPAIGTQDATFSASVEVDLDERKWRRSTLTGDIDLAVLRLLEPSLRASGTAHGSIELSGTLDDPTFSGTLEIDGGSFSHPDAPYAVTSLAGPVRFDGDRIRTPELSGRIGLAGADLSDDPGQSFTVSGTFPFAALGAVAAPDGPEGESEDGEREPEGEDAGRGRAPAGEPFTVQVSVDDLPLRPLIRRSDLFSELLTGARASADMTLRGRGLEWRTYDGELHLRGLVLDLSQYTLTLASPTRVELRDGAFHLREARLSGAGSDLRVDGSVALAPTRLDLSATGTLGLDPLNNLSEDWGIAGAADLELRLVGQTPDLRYQGTVEIRDGLLNPPVLLQPIDSIAATLRFDNRRVVIERLAGELGGGELTADGEILLRGSRPENFRLAFSLEEVLLRIEREVRLTVSGNVVHEGTPDRSLLSGSLDVESGLYRREWSPGEPILEAMGGPEVDRPLLATVQLDVEVDAPRDLRIDNNIADTEMRADLTLRGTLEEPVLLGRTEAVEGEIYWQGNTYRILQATVEFGNPLRTEPVFDIRAETTMRQYTITLNFTGSFDRGIAFNYSSSPPLSDIELVRLLAFGGAPREAEEQTGLGATVGLQATRFLTSQYLAEVERGAQRAFGLDRFRIEPSLRGSRADPTARITIGEQVTRNLLVTYSTTLGASDEQLLTVEYQLARGIRIIGVREEDGSIGIDIHFDYRY